MRHIRLVSFEDQPTGSLGLIFKGCEGDTIFSDTAGGLLAHDLIEHQNGVHNIGCPEDELQAMGGLWHTRGRHGTMNDSGYNIWSPYQHVGFELCTIAEQTDYQEHPRRWWPGDRRYDTQPHEHDEDFREIIDFARQKIDGYDLEGFPIEAFFTDALHLMRIGFNKAKRRFGMGYESNNLYLDVRGAVAPHCKRIDYAGQEFRLSYGNGEARCTEIYETFD